ncbi:MAG TPA: hypothetical protein VKB88_23380 [Bryobacteraceae bacterium]|nr:hypothetical protein [Bryobacteraceae bacterium]
MTEFKCGKKCPFANVPEKRAGRWGGGLTAAEMEACRWLKPMLVGQFEFVEWTADGRLAAQPFYGAGRPPNSRRRCCPGDRYVAR